MKTHALRFCGLMWILAASFLMFLSLRPAQAQFTVLHSFSGGDGSTPYGPVTLVGSTLYGMTFSGGLFGNGVLYSVDVDGSNFNVLHDFEYAVSGAFPYYGLTAVGSTLYGTTSDGGTNTAGVIFSYDTLLNNLTVHYAFSGTEGGNLLTTPAVSGPFIYGTGNSGGTSGVGVIFRYDTFGGTYNVLHHFDATNGAFPRGELTLSGSTLYGMTSAGGLFNQGVIYRINTDGSGYTVLHVFTNGNPQSGLTLAGNTLYGMAAGGAFGFGQIFSIGTDGSGFTTLHSFDYFGGANPAGSLALSGNTLFGMTAGGGNTNDYGVVFSVNTDGTGFTVLHEFAGGAGGRYPYFGAPVVAGSNLYGSAFYEGSGGEGIVFGLVIPEPSTVGLFVVGVAFLAFARRARSFDGA
jgi:uncharacterized repeat protein (TIGR03803 family)